MDKFKTVCMVCKQEIPSTHPCLNGPNGAICMGCEFAMIKVWHVTLPGEEGGGYYDTNIDHIVNMLNECGIGDGYTVIRKEIRAAEYYNLPEFGGF